MSRYFPDELLASYIKMRERRKLSFSSSELVYFLLFQTDLTFENGEATRTVEAFLARRNQGIELIDVIEQIRRKKEDAEREALIASLRQLARRHRRGKAMKTLLRFSFLGIWMFSLFSRPHFGGVGLAAYVLSLGFADWIVDMLTRKQLDLDAVKALAQYGGARSTGLLAEALTIADIRVQVEQALIRELPKLKASDAPLLNEEQRYYLYQALTTRNNTNLILAILKALEQVGDEKAIPFVERLAEGKANFKSQEVRKAAATCLPYLREQAAKQKEHQTLLRPSSAADVVTTAPDTLLRPAQYGGSTTEPQELLRASAGE
jgi:hypothetical protein